MLRWFAWKEGFLGWVWVGIGLGLGWVGAGLVLVLLLALGNCNSRRWQTEPKRLDHGMSLVSRKHLAMMESQSVELVELVEEATPAGSSSLAI